MAFAICDALLLSLVLELFNSGVELLYLSLLFLYNQQQLIESAVRDFFHLCEIIFNYAALGHLDGVDVLLYLAR